MKSKVLTIILILSLGLNIGVLTKFGHNWFKQRDHERIHNDAEWRKDKIRRELGLSEDQVCLFEQDRKIIEGEIKLIKEQLKNKRLELFNTLDAEPVDQLKVDKLIDSISFLQAKIEKTVLGHLITMKKNLTSEQRQKLKTMMPKGFMPPSPEQLGMDKRERPPVRPDMDNAEKPPRP